MIAPALKLIFSALLLQLLLFSPLDSNAQRKSEEVLYAEFLDFIKSKNLLIENEYFNLVEKYGTLEKSFWLVGGRKYKIFCFSTTGNIKDLNSYVYDAETNELLAEHTINHPLGINDFVSRERRRIRVVIKLQEHYNDLTTKMRIVIAYTNLPQEQQKIEETKPLVEKPAPPIIKSKFTAQTLVEELNNSIRYVDINFIAPKLRFDVNGQIDKNKRSFQFLEINNKLYLNFTIPATDPCGPINRTIPAKWSGSTGSGSEYYYVKFLHTVTCGINKYEDIYVFFNTKSSAYSDEMTEIIKGFCER